MRATRPIAGIVLVAGGALVAAWGVTLMFEEEYDIDRAGWILFGSIGVAIGLVIAAGGYLVLRPRARGKRWAVLILAAVAVAALAPVFGTVATLVVWPLVALAAFLAAVRMRGPG